MTTPGELNSPGPLPITVRVVTGGGGEHILMAHPGVRVANSASSLGAGVDVRGDGGYIIAAGSNHKSGGSYRWHDGCGPEVMPVADIPATWLEALGKPGKGRSHGSGGGVGQAVARDPTTGKIIDGREGYKRDIRHRVYQEMMDETGQVPELKEFTKRSWLEFSEAVELGPTATSGNSYTWEGWERDCPGDHRRLAGKYKPGLLPGIEPTYPARDLLTLEEAQEELTQIIGEFAAQPEDTLIRVTAGAGKSYLAASVIGLVLDGRVLHIFVPDHQLAEETLERWSKHGSAVVVEGRDKAGCGHDEAVKDAVAAGVSVKAVCCTACPDRQGCAYLAQFQQEAQIWIFPKAYLTLELDDNIPKPDLIMVDEDCLGELAQVVEPFPAADLTGVGSGVLLEWLRNPQGDLRDHLGRLGFDRTALASNLKDMRDMRAAYIRRLIVNPTMVKTATKPDRMIDVLEALLAEWDSGTSLRSVVYHAGMVVIRRWRGDNNLTAPTLFLDATAEERLFQIRWPDIRFHRLDVRQNIRATQISSTTVGKGGLLTGTRKENLIAKLQRVIDQKAEGHELGLIVTYKAAEEGGLFQVPPGWSIAHFGGKLRGTNSYQEATCVVVIGRYMVPDYAVHNFAAALCHGLPLEIEFQKRDYAECGYRLRDGRSGVMVQAFSDPILAAVDRLRLEAETEQALARVRGVRAEITKDIVILSKVPLDLDVDELVPLDDLARWGRTERMWEEHGSPVMPTAAPWLMAKFPQYCRSEKTAKRAGSDLRSGGWTGSQGGQTDYKGTLSRFDPLSLEYKITGQSGSKTKAAIRPGASIWQLDHIQSELEQHHGGKEIKITPEEEGRLYGYSAAANPDPFTRRFLKTWIDLMGSTSS